jgi:aryl sulfotransferase
LSGATTWLASYPKSGNTWLRAVLSAWQGEGPVDINRLAGGAIASAREPFDVSLGIASSDLTHEEVELLRPRVDEILSAHAPGALLRKVHDALFAGPATAPAVSIGATRSALYMVRDPRDVAVSLARHLGRTVEWAAERMRNPAAAVAADPAELAEQLRQRLGTWSDHVRGWVDEAPFPVHVVRYEDCLDDPMATFGAALEFAGLGPVDPERLAGAVARAAFERLRDAEENGGFRERSAAAERFFRRGQAGAWRDEMPPEVAAGMLAEHREIMARFKYW